MSIRIDHLLKQWYPQRDTTRWALALITNTEGSSYRKAGAIMLLSELGQRLGLLSGGCLEHHIHQQARRAWLDNQPQRVRFQLSEDGDQLWQQGIGCGGRVDVLVLPLSQENGYLKLADVHLRLAAGDIVDYALRIDQSTEAKVQLQPGESRKPATYCRERNEEHWLHMRLAPAPHLVICGFGADAVPLAQIALNMGWRVSAADSRTEAFANAQGLGQRLHAGKLFTEGFAALSDYERRTPADAVVLMNHSLELDASALHFAHGSSASYIGLLGPEHRRLEVEQRAGLNASYFEGRYYHGPAGLDIGARLPETIALSILAQAHECVEGHRVSKAPLNTPCLS